MTPAEWDAYWIRRMAEVMLGRWQLDRHMAEGEGTGVDFSEIPPEAG